MSFVVSGGLEPDAPAPGERERGFGVGVNALWVSSRNPPLRGEKSGKKKPPWGTGKPAEGERTGPAAFREAVVYTKDPGLIRLRPL